MIRWQHSAHGFLTYRNTSTSKEVHVWEGDLADIGKVYTRCQNVVNSAIYRLATQEDYSYRNLTRALRELEVTRDYIDESNTVVDPDDYLDLLTAIEDLEGILRRIKRIAQN